MKNAPHRLVVTLFCLAGFAIMAAQYAAASPGEPVEPSGPVGMGFVVQDFFGGQILGYGVDQDGTRGLLSEYVELPDGNLLIATELFDPNTGIILGVVERETETQDNFVTLGVVGNHVGLRQIQHVQNGYVVSRTYNMMNPIQGNKFNGAWLPPINNSKVLFEDIEGDQGNPNTAVMASNFLCCGREVFGSNVAANRFGPIVTLTDPVLTGGVPPLLAYYSATNQAVLAQAQGAPYSTPEVALVNLTTRSVTEFTGLGDGFVNGLAVDSTTGIACTTTETDNSAEFYNLATQTGFIVTLPVIGKYSGGLVAADPVHHLFLITHPRPASVGEIHVYDENGNLQESLDGFSMGPAGATIAVVPGRRMGFLQSPGRNRNMSGLQSFTY